MGVGLEGGRLGGGGELGVVEEIMTLAIELDVSLFKL